MRLENTCPTQSEETRIILRWLGNKMLETIRSDPNTIIPVIVDKEKRQFGLEVPRMMAWRAKKKAKDIVLGDHKKQYRRLRDYLETMKLTNPGSRCIVSTVSGKTKENPTVGPRFHVVHIRDANNNMYPIAFGVVGVEDTPNWSWFLTQLKYALGGSEEGKFGKYTFMSDKQKVLFEAHLCKLLESRIQRRGFEEMHVDAAAYAYTEHDFILVMDSMKAECIAAWEGMSRIPPKAWSRHAVDINCKTDLVVNKLSEVFNNYILDVRNKPIVTMINGIKDKFLVMFHQKREGGKCARWEIAPTYAAKLEMNKKYERDCKALIAGQGLFQVTSVDKTYAVDTNYRYVGARNETSLDFLAIMLVLPSIDSWVKTPTPDIDPPQFKDDKKGTTEEKM
ncbi:uncharacterized protein [Aegilops tauschii subsp. strangulata]|uniref:uncharacterized protein n=1 Tax=Aegilops tauschii subsp. strangulata TaxID=200361 RepID=UPI001ABD1137|nr:uncharacterized protein LOC120969149 [Aegilops tauschii subsp. strangulata]